MQSCVILDTILCTQLKSKTHLKPISWKNEKLLVLHVTNKKELDHLVFCYKAS